MIKIFFLIVGVFSCSTSVIFIKLSTEHPLLLATYRLFVAAIFLTPIFIREKKRLAQNYGIYSLRKSLLPGIVLAFHFITWITGARLTMASNATIIVNMVPIVMPLFSFFLLREKITKQEYIGTAIALAGLALLSGMDFHIAKNNFLGDVLSFIAMILFALYLALGRKNRGIPHLMLYLVPLYYVAALFSLGFSIFFINPIKPYTIKNILLILGLGIIPTIVCHSLLNYAMKYFRSQTVSLINLTQFIFAAIMGFIFLNETPSTYFYIASIFIVGGGYLAIHSGEKVKR